MRPPRSSPPTIASAIIPGPRIAIVRPAKSVIGDAAEGPSVGPEPGPAPTADGGRATAERQPAERQPAGLAASTAARAAARSVYQVASTGVNVAHSAGSWSSGKIAFTGHSGSQAPQSMHSFGSM